MGGPEGKGAAEAIQASPGRRGGGIYPLFQLLRPPNLFTVPGDPLCGALLASQGAWSWRVVPPVVASLACYCAGLILNDLADLKEDLRDRPGRPLPSGAVSRRAAIALAAVFIAVALAAASLINTILLLLTGLLLVEILWYDFMAKRNAITGPIAMGICRGLSVLLGAAAIAPPPPLAVGAAAAVALYIGAVTALARNETRSPRIPRLIGVLISALIFIQAGFCLLAGGTGRIAAVVLLALWPISRLVASRFYAS